MEFGFVTSQVVKELEEIGNWKVTLLASQVINCRMLLPNNQDTSTYLSVMNEWTH